MYVFICKQKYMEKVNFRLAETFFRFEDFGIANKQVLFLFIFFPIYLYSCSCWGHVLWDRTQKKVIYLQGNTLVGLWLDFLCNQDYYQVNTKGYLRKLFFSDDSREYLDNALHFYNEIHYEVSLCCIWTV